MLSTAAGDPDRIFSCFDFQTHECVIAAVSGGSDSTALLLLLKAHLDRAAPATRLFCATVDHGLRPESAAEAARVAALCQRIGVAHATLRWKGEKPGTGISAAAREARHELLADLAEREGARLVLTGHTADDQAETVLMRRQRGRGPGLAGIAPATLFDTRIWFARPLLSMRRQALRDYLRQHGVSWIEDPTNENPIYERARLRAGLKETAEGDSRVAGALAQADAAAQSRADLAGRTAALMGTHATRPAAGLLRLAPDFAASPDRPAALHVLRILLATAGGTQHLPEEGAADRLLERMCRGAGRATLSRSLVDMRARGIYLLREQRSLPQQASVLQETVWDGRYRVRLPGELLGCMIGPVGTEYAGPAAERADSAPASLLRAAFAAEPALWRGRDFLGALVGWKPAAGVRALPAIGPWTRYLPSFDLAAARALGELVGAPDLPPPPCSGHIGRNA